MLAKYYQLYKDLGNGKISAVCKLCTKKDKIIRGYVKVTSNFVSHLKSHPSSYEEFTDINQSRSRKRSHKATSTENPSSSKKKNYEVEVRDKHSAQVQANNLVTDFIVKLGLPLNLVNHQAMIDMVTGLSKIPFEVHCISSYKMKGMCFKRFKCVKVG